MSMLSRDLSTLNTVNNFGTKAFSYDDNPEVNYAHKELRKVVLATTFLVAVNATSPNFSIPEGTAKVFIEPIAADQVLDITRQDLALLTKIREKATYSNNWDGNGAQKISKEAINDAERFIRLLLVYSIYSPIISVAADGEINFLWILPNFRFDLGVYGDKTLSYYGKTSDGKEYMADDINITEVLPSYIIDLIKK